MIFSWPWTYINRWTNIRVAGDLRQFNAVIAPRRRTNPPIGTKQQVGDLPTDLERSIYMPTTKRYVCYDIRFTRHYDHSGVITVLQMAWCPVYLEISWWRGLTGIHLGPVSKWGCRIYHIDGLVKDCSNSSVLAMELLQSCTKPSILHSLSHEFTSTAAIDVRDHCTICLLSNPYSYCTNGLFCMQDPYWQAKLCSRLIVFIDYPYVTTIGLDSSQSNQNLCAYTDFWPFVCYHKGYSDSKAESCFAETITSMA